jgi:glycosyltransferase involved in cell wall biosynthesis
MEHMPRPPKVSVCVITFNQEKYIRQCLQSIVDQQTDFDFEVIVGDDFSTDSTREVVLEFASRYPGKVIPLLYPQKIGGTQNYMEVHNRAVGTYVAHIDGDDIALPGKLQAQVDYLEAHSDCSVVWHRMNLFNDEGTLNKPNLPDVRMFDDGKVFLSDVLKFGSVGYHSSLMYRASARNTREVDGDTLDYFYTIELLMSGYGKYLEDVLGRYRYNINTGISKKGKGSKFVMRVYANHLNHYLLLSPKFRKDIFINSMIYFLIELKNWRASALYFLKLALRTFSWVSPWEFISYLKRFRRINAGI